MAIVYGTLYMLFGAYPIVYQVCFLVLAIGPMQRAHEQQTERGWSQGIGSLPFLGIAVGMIAAVTYSALDNAYRYVKLADKYKGFAPPETRLPPTMIGGVAATIGLFCE